MLTPDEKKEIKKFLLEGKSKFQIAKETGHAYKTISMVKKRMGEDLTKHQDENVRNEDVRYINVDVGFLAQLLVEQAIDSEYPVLLPVPFETAEKFYKIEKLFYELGPVLTRAAEEAAKADKKNSSEK